MKIASKPIANINDCAGAEGATDRKTVSNRKATARPVVHTINLTNSLPIPEILAAELAPGIAAGDKLRFEQYGFDGCFQFRTVPFTSWDWLVSFDYAMHKHGAPQWAGACTNALYAGECEEHTSEQFSIWHSPAMIVTRGDLLVATRWEGYANGNPVHLSSAYNDPARGWPEQFYPSFYGLDVIRFEDLRLGRQLVDLIEAGRDDEVGLSDEDCDWYRTKGVYEEIAAYAALHDDVTAHEMWCWQVSRRAR